MESDKGMAVLDIFVIPDQFEISILSLYSLVWQKQGSQEVHAVISIFLSFILSHVGKTMRKGDLLTKSQRSSIRKVKAHDLLLTSPTSSQVSWRRQGNAELGSEVGIWNQWSNMALLGSYLIGTQRDYFYV